jgi:hypothetical protein
VNEMDHGGAADSGDHRDQGRDRDHGSVATEEHQQRTQTGHDDAADDGDQCEHIEYVRRHPRRTGHRRRCGRLARGIGQRWQVGEQPVEIGLRPPGDRRAQPLLQFVVAQPPGGEVRGQLVTGIRALPIADT